MALISLNTEEPVEHEGVLNYFMSSLVDLDPFIWLGIWDKRKAFNLQQMPDGEGTRPLGTTVLYRESVEAMLALRGYQYTAFFVGFDKQELPDTTDHDDIVGRNIVRLRVLKVTILFEAEEQKIVSLRGSSFLDAGYVWAPYIPVTAVPRFRDVSRDMAEAYDARLSDDFVWW